MFPVLVWCTAASIVALGWFGSRAIRGWRDSATRLAERRAAEAADRLATILSRDMRGVQSAVLATAQGDQFMIDQPFDVRAIAASAFARYPYPESFFAWRGAPEPDAVVFLDRSDRHPPWMPGQSPRTSFPVVVDYAPGIARSLIDRIQNDAARGRRFSFFETRLGGERYQVVARLLYRDPLREHLEGVFGFTVNIRWVRANYFPDVARQVARIDAPGTTLPLAVLDGSGAQVAGEVDVPPPLSRREFPLAFFDPRLVLLDRPDDLPVEVWVAAAGAGRDPALTDAVQGGNRTLLVAGAAAVAFVLGLGMTARATRARTRLAELRSEFVSTVTHELKTPIAAIRAAGDTMARGRLTTPDARRDYAELVVQQSKRLSRLVDNLLAYSRITDVTEAYTFVPLDPRALLDDVVEGFRSALQDGGFDVCVEVKPGTHAIRGDRTACVLLLDNLVDNAIRYSRDERSIRITAQSSASMVTVAVQDHGTGIPEDERAQVTRRFFRGRHARSGGSGLGLAIAARIAADHGGTLQIDSAVGVGTTVSVTLPAADRIA
jgi:signal transduction histidine kinase